MCSLTAIRKGLISLALAFTILAWKLMARSGPSAATQWSGAQASTLAIPSRMPTFFTRWVLTSATCRQKNFLKLSRPENQVLLRKAKIKGRTPARAAASTTILTSCQSLMTWRTDSAHTSTICSAWTAIIFRMSYCFVCLLVGRDCPVGLIVPRGLAHALHHWFHLGTWLWVRPRDKNKK